MRSSRKSTLYLIPYVHLDTQWRWSLSTTIRNYLPSTVAKNLELIAAYPHYCINLTGAYRYALIGEYYPHLLSEIQQQVADHRWHPSGSMWEETDVLIPSAESIIRNILYGKSYFQQHFGRQTNDVMLPDSFGFPVDFPTVLAHCRISGFSTQKLSWDPVQPVPFTLGIWNGPDGSGITSLFKPGSYTSRLHIPPHRDLLWKRRLLKQYRTHGTRRDAHYYGAGDIGQAPSTRSVKQAEKSLRAAGELVKQGPSDAIFTDLSTEELDQLPRYAGELMLRRHSAGSLSSQRIMKRWNKQGELLACLAESAAVTAALQTHTPYPGAAIEQAWKLLIANQMHDILPGTCSPDACLHSQNSAVLMLNLWQGIICDSMIALSRQLPLRKGEQALFLYNPYAFSRSEQVNAVIPLSQGQLPLITDPQGRQITSQIIEQSARRAHIVFDAEVPSVGWSSYRLGYGTTEDPEETAAEPGAVYDGDDEDSFILENDLLKVTVDSSGDIASIFDKRVRSEVLEAPIHYQFLHEYPHTFPSWNMDWKDRRRGPYARLGEQQAVISWKARGPLQDILEIRRSHGQSHFTQKIQLNKTSRQDVILCTDHIQWRERACSLKLAIPLSFSNSCATYSMNSSQITRGTSSSRYYEYLSKGWIDQETEDGSYGVAFLHGDIYGSDRPDDHTIRPTFLFTPGRSFRTFTFLDQMTQDMGEHTIIYGIHPHTGSWKAADIDALAKTVAAPLKPFLISRNLRAMRNHRSYPAVSSLFSLSSRQLGLLTLKRAERDSHRIIIRLRELYGQDIAHASITFSRAVKDAYEVDGCEAPLKPVNVTGMSISFAVQKNSILAFSLLLVPTDVAESADSSHSHYQRVFIQSERSPELWEHSQEQEDENSVTELDKSIPIDLKGNTVAFTSHDRTHSGWGATLPLEQIPPLLIINDIPFRLMTDKQYHAVACGNEQFTIPRLQDGSVPQYFSCIISSDEDTDTTFTIVDEEGLEHLISCRVYAAAEAVGRYDTRVWKRAPKGERNYLWWNRCTALESGFIKDQRIALHTSHIHASGEDLPGHFGYLFFHRFRLPAGATTLILPADARIRLYALTVSSSTSEAVDVSLRTDRFDR